MPGPEAHRLAVYIGWLLHRMRGGMVAAFGRIGTVEALCFGSKAAMLSGITAAVAGAMLNLALWFARRTLFGRVGDASALG
jgi:chromate transport protein ChrA